jgi:hypothetical protein
MRNPTVSWQKSGQHDVEITIPHPKSARGSLAARVFMIPEMKKYRLDEIGALVWILSDGEHTCKEIVEALCRRYKYVKREAELSLMSYMQTLSARNLVGFVKSRASEESETKSV